MSKNFKKSVNLNLTDDLVNNKTLANLIHNIKNFKTLADQDIKQINDMSYENRLQVFRCYNDMIFYYNEVINNDS